MNLTRYYHKKPIDSGHVRAVRDVLSSSFHWEFAYANYCVYYTSEFYSLDHIAEVDQIVAEKGQPKDVRVAFTSKGGRTFNLETRDPGRMSITVDNKEDPPSKILDAIEPVLSLESLGEVPRGQTISSAFVAHAFDDEGHKYANELARFLQLIGIRSESGRAFSPARVSDKVNMRLAKHDMFIAIVTPQEDHTWITQEIATAAALKKYLFILKQSDVVLKEGILGDHEYVPFSKDQISKTFIPILEGINEIRGGDEQPLTSPPAV